jgi:hypothetical protein
MKKEKVYCHSCIFYIPKGKRSSSTGDVWNVPDKCISPISLSTRIIRATYHKPRHEQRYVEKPEVLNKNNNCKGYYFGIHNDRLAKPKKSWWKRWFKNL